MANDPIVDLKLNLDITGVNDALYDMIGDFKGTDKQFAAIAASIDKNAKMLEASIKRFGPASKEAENASKSLQKSLTGLVAYGINPTSDAFIKLEKSLPQVSSVMDNAGNSIKKNNMQLTNLALVLQDLPFGFRGIQNNLPALLGSAAGATGGMYLAFSALIAAVTAYDMGLFSATKTNDDFNKSLKTTNEELRKAVNYTNSDTANLESLLRVGLNLNNSESIRLNALKDIKKILGAVNKEEADKITTIEGASNSINMYTEALKKQELQEAASGKIAALQTGLVEKRAALQIAEKGGARGLNILNVFGYDSADDLRKDVLDAETQIRLLEDILDQANKKTFVNPFAKGIEKPKIDKDALKLQKEQDAKLIAGTKALEDITLSLLDERGQKESKARMQLRDRIIALEEAGFSDFTNAYAAYEKELVEIRKFYDDKELKERQEINDKLYAAQIAESDRLLQNRLDVLAIESQVRAKLNRKQPNMVVEGYKEDLQALYRELNQTIVEGGTAKQIEKIEDAIVRMKGTIEGATPVAQNFAVTWLETTNKINKALADLAVNSAISIGESLGKALAGEDVDAFGALGEVLATALTQIGQALIAFAILEGAALESLKDPTKWPVALAAGIAAVAAGAFLKSKLNSKKDTKVAATPFANGGIISGPTLGLMGEYPGAKTNPEVVAPLDKLKDMIGGQGGGSGMFVLRGQDLLLSVNRAQKASTLKGQNISLG